MPDKDVNTILDLIYYQYAKIIARRTFGVSNGKEAKRKHYGFIKETFRELKSGIKSWSEITREDWQFVESERKCIYCGTENYTFPQILDNPLSLVHLLLRMAYNKREGRQR